jgi:ATP-dependent helicase/DNAse subunit B
VQVTRASAEAESIRSLNTNLTSTLFQANSKYQQQQHAEHQQHLSHKLQQIVEEIQRVFAKKEQGWQQRLDALQAEMSTRQREYLQVLFPHLILFFISTSYLNVYVYCLFSGA